MLRARQIGPLVIAICFGIGALACNLSVNMNVTDSSTSTPIPVRRNCAPAPDGLIGWWRGEGNARDELGKNHGALSGEVNFVPGQVGQAFHFDGRPSSVDIPRSTELDPSQQVTVEFWINVASNNALYACQGLVTTDFYVAEISPCGPQAGVNFAVSSDSGQSFHHTSDPTATGVKVARDEWHHVAGTYNGQMLQVYLDGKPEAQTAYSGRISPMLSGSFLSIGSEDGRTNCPACRFARYFIGLIDEVSIYNRALTLSEIQSVFAAGSAGKCMSHQP
jgi:hypothetical protein